MARWQVMHAAHWIHIHTKTTITINIHQTHMAMSDSLPDARNIRETQKLDAGHKCMCWQVGIAFFVGPNCMFWHVKIAIFGKSKLHVSASQKLYFSRRNGYHKRFNRTIDLS